MTVDLNKILILKRSQSENRFEDITKDVLSITEQNSTYYIQYVSGSAWHHKKCNIRILDNPRERNISGQHLFHKEIPLVNVTKVLQFEDWIRVFFVNGKPRCYPLSEFRILDIANKEQQIDTYLKYIREIIERIEQDKDVLKTPLRDLDIVKESVIYKFLNERPPQKEKVFDKNKVIFPFGCNKAQKQAVFNALSWDMSLIQGPPGTGKTQTILNIICNLIINNKTVAVVSGNNEATRNVNNKLQSVGLDFLAAFLGNTDNRKDFFSVPHSFPPICAQWKNEKIDRFQLETRLAELYRTVDTLLQCNIDAAKLRCRITEYQIERAVNQAQFSIEKDISPKLSSKHYTLERLMELKAELLLLDESKRRKFFTKLRFLMRYGIFNIRKHFVNETDVINFLDERYYRLKLSLLQKELKQKNTVLEKEDLNTLLASIQQVSFSILKTAVMKNYLQTDDTLTKENYRFHFKKFLRRFPIVFSTTHALRSCSGIHSLYDYVIIDESSQVDLASATVALACAKNVVLVGDLHQLPHVVAYNKELLQNIFFKYSLRPQLEYCDNSILKSFTIQYGKTVPNIMLNEHYRCDPEIIEFCNKRFYNGQLIIQRKHVRGNGVHVRYTESQHARYVEIDKDQKGWLNERQVDVIEKEILPVLNANSVGIIAPYRLQVALLTERLKGRGCLIDTVHKFQGKECDTIIMSTVKNRIHISDPYSEADTIDFLNDPHLLNVAISRAKNQLFVIISEALMKQPGAILSDFVRYIKYFCSQGTVEKTKVYSILDLQYKEFAPILESFRKQLKIVSNFQGENIIWSAISSLCKEEKFDVLDCVHHYPLHKVVNADIIVDEEERKFLLNPNTHCDFVIYDRMDKSVRLVVELDGMQHRKPDQQARDKKKNSILRQANIPLLRLTTTSCDCREKIEAALTSSIIAGI